MSRITVTSQRARLSAQVDGEAGRPWLLLSNSLAADLNMWDDQIPLLTRTHRVVRYDTRGHGQSEAPEGPYDFPMLVADMVAVLDAVGADQADVIGLSLGGMTALGLGLSHPDRVRRLVVCDARADAPAPFVQGWDDRIAAVEGKGTEALVEGTLNRWFTPRAPQAPRERAAAMIRATAPAGYIGCARALQGLDYLKDLPHMTVPVLYVVGEEDQGAPRAAMQAMADATPGGRLVVLPGLAHVPNMEDPSAFAQAIEAWLADTPAEAAPGPVGIVGLGIMGSAYAANLRKGGIAVVGYDPAPEAQEILRAAGGTVVGGPREVAEAAEVLLFALPSARVLEATVEAMLPVLGPRHVIAEMGTLPLKAKEAARDRVAPTGATLLDCPVSGTGAQAAVGDLVVFMSGEAAACDHVRPVFALMARDVRHVGAFGAGMKLKLVANLLVTIHNLSTAEALIFARRAGLDLNMVYDGVRTGAGGSRMFDLRAPLMIEGRYEPATMKMEVYMKDLALIMEEAAAMGVPVPLMAASLPFYYAALAQGRHKEDTAALFAVLERMTEERP